jgi:integrase
VARSRSIQSASCCHLSHEALVRHASVDVVQPDAGVDLVVHRVLAEHGAQDLGHRTGVAGQVQGQADVGEFQAFDVGQGVRAIEGRKGRADPTAASAKKAREAARKAKVRSDCLQREQLAALRWEEVNTQWRGLDLKDKIEDRRAVPLTPYVAHLLAGLPKRNGWVFSSAQALAGDAKNAARRARYHASRGTQAPESDVSIGSASGRLVDPSIAHRRACAAAGLDGLTLHGLRRSFASLCEWLDIPGGISAQIQGHAPQGVREQNYIRRPPGPAALALREG